MRAPRIVAWAGIGFAIAVFSFAVVVNFSLPGKDPVLVWADLAWHMSFLAFAVLGGLLIRREPRNSVGWILLVGGLFELASSVEMYADLGLLHREDPLPGAVFASWAQLWLWVPGFAAVSLLVLVFPTGRLLSPVWRLALVPLTIGTVITLVSAFSTWPRRGPALLANEDAGLDPALEFALAVGYPLMLLAVLFGLAALIVRYRRAGTVERLQMKWFLYGVAIVFVTVVLQQFVKEPAGGTWWDLLVVNLPVLALPGSLGIAMFRYRLYDIDAIVNRTLVYGSLTAILVGFYLSAVLLMQALLSGVTSDSDLAIAASTLAVAALFRPLRARVQQLIDRRFYRRKYDAARSLDAFAQRLRDEVEIEVLEADVLNVLTETVEPAHSSLWLVGGRTR
jgi:hypothetical protein